MNKKIISLTSISSRSEILKFTIESLLNQTLKPDEIHLNISKNSYLIDNGYKSIPPWLSVLEKENKIIINFVENIGPYRKLIPLINNLQNDDIIVICDDDVIYSNDWFQSLINQSIDNPNKVICGHARKIKKNVFNITQSYLHWPVYSGNLPKRKLLPIGVGGVLYKPSFFNLNHLNNKIFLSIAKVNDDLWFWNSLKISIEILSISYSKPLFYTIQTNNNLASINYSYSNNFLKRIKNKLFEVLGYFGISAINNDKVFKQINKVK